MRISKSKITTLNIYKTPESDIFWFFFFSELKIRVYDEVYHYVIL